MRKGVQHIKSSSFINSSCQEGVRKLDPEMWVKQILCLVNRGSSGVKVNWRARYVANSSIPSRVDIITWRHILANTKSTAKCAIKGL